VHAYTTPADVQAALGPSTDVTADPYLQQCVDASNATCSRKRLEAGYVDVDPVPPAVWPPDVVMGATLYAVALWRERASADSYQSFDELQGAVLTGGAWPQIKRLLGIPKGRVDTPLSYADARARRRELLYPPVVAPL